MFKRTIILALVLVMSLSAVGMAAAQDPGTDRDRVGEGQIAMLVVLRTASDQMEMTIREFISMSSADQSLGEAIVAAGGDLNAISADSEARLQELADMALAQGRISQEEYDSLDISNVVATILSSPVPMPDPNRERDMIGIEAALISATVDALDVRPAEIAQFLRNDQSLNDFITANGGDPAAIAASTATSISERVGNAVAEGRISQERADALLSNLDAQIAEAMDSTDLLFDRDGRERPRDDRERRLTGDFLNTLADELGISVQDIFNARRDGMSLAEIIEANGGSVEAISTQLQSAVEIRVNEAVENGRITEERAAEILSNLASRIEQFLNRSNSPE